MRFKTESGTWYKIANGSWSRLSRTETSGRTRHERGIIVGTPHVVVGQPAMIQDESVLPGHSIHYIRTSPVVEIIED